MNTNVLPYNVPFYNSYSEALKKGKFKDKLWALVKSGIAFKYKNKDGSKTIVMVPYGPLVGTWTYNNFKKKLSFNEFHLATPDVAKRTSRSEELVKGYLPVACYLAENIDNADFWKLHSGPDKKPNISYDVYNYRVWFAQHVEPYRNMFSEVFPLQSKNVYALGAAAYNYLDNIRLYEMSLTNPFLFWKHAGKIGREGLVQIKSVLNRLYPLRLSYRQKYKLFNNVMELGLKKGFKKSFKVSGKFLNSFLTVNALWNKDNWKYKKENITILQAGTKTHLIDAYSDTLTSREIDYLVKLSEKNDNKYRQIMVWLLEYVRVRNLFPAIPFTRLQIIDAPDTPFIREHVRIVQCLREDKEQMDKAQEAYNVEKHRLTWEWFEEADEDMKKVVRPLIYRDDFLGEHYLMEHCIDTHFGGAGMFAHISYKGEEATLQFGKESDFRTPYINQLYGKHNSQVSAEMKNYVVTWLFPAYKIAHMR
jgi:hypothetical protein